MRLCDDRRLGTGRGKPCAAFRNFVCAEEKRLMMDVGRKMKMNKDDYLKGDKVR